MSIIVINKIEKGILRIKIQKKNNFPPGLWIVDKKFFFFKCDYK